MSLTNKKVSQSYKDLLHLNNSGLGISASNIHTVKDGNGSSTSLQVGRRGSIIHSAATDTVSTFTVETVASDPVLKVETSTKLVKVNETQSIANTQYLRFFAHDIDTNSGTHYGVPLVGIQDTMPNTEVTFGASTDPTYPTISNNADDLLHYLHYVDTNITVDAVNIMVAATASSADSLNFHLMEFEPDSTTIVDAFSAATVVADDSGTSIADYSAIYRIALDIQSADVNAGRFLALTIEGNGTNADYSINGQIRYHLR